MSKRNTVLAVIGLALWLPLTLCLTSISGCAHNSTGILRPIDPAVEHGITNAIANVVKLAPTVIPFPWSGVIQATGAATLALLAAWQGLTHRAAAANTEALKRLQDKSST